MFYKISRMLILFLFFLFSTLVFPKLVVSHDAGFYDSEFYVSINSTLSGSVYYTLDGSEPVLGNPNTYTYTKPIHITERKDNKLMYIPTSPIWKEPSGELKKGTVLRIIEVVDGKVVDSTSRTYFVGIRHTLPVVSIIVNPDDMFDYERGIYVPGKLFDPNNPYWTGNYHQRGSEWERTGVLEYFENSKLLYRTDIGIRIHGEFTRSFPIKSIRLYARNKEKEFTYPFFGRVGYKKLLLRNSGNDYEYTYMRDPVVQEVVKGLGFDTQDSYPVVHYINGEYRGILYLSEYYDQRFLQVKHKVNEKNTVIINYDLSIQDGKEGDQQSFLDLLEFVRNNDMRKDENYRVVSSMLDIDNFIDFKITEIISANTDWPGNNERMWRVLEKENSPFGDGKWRYMMYDMDLAFWEPSHNTLKVALYGDPNVPWTMREEATLLLRKLLENESFKNKFVQRFEYILNEVFKPERVENIISRYENMLEPEIELHAKRYGTPEPSFWKEEVGWLKNFMYERRKFIIAYFDEMFK
ncbi:CotH kinase family protein [Fervidobacterium gondwanense]|uniref:CotH kinase family protein n=1 Tax=Fervidobacterium gondwanense TaxID=44754 RepID=UPI003C78F953